MHWEGQPCPMILEHAKSHARNRRPTPSQRGWYSTGDYARRTGDPVRTVRYWCSQGSIPSADGTRLLPVAGGDGHDYRIPLEAL